ncbi:hypothetical protein PRZ48_009787 [Zasmidium cellare]|uniref:Uncharacterized protein n=1 Tax=Zasmidium cellare TaxID=395010 RepID=A0ABR0ED37_ZASCE|nr:hypothetical protein PRZ48_009787 [Zasmidium cellare]
MPPGQSIPANLSFAVARKILKAEDMERLACAFLNATDTVKFDAEKAAREFGGVKADSFKRSIWVITKTLKEHGGGDGGDAASTPKQRGRKRKADADEGESPVKKKGKGGKKSKAEVEEDADDEVSVKAEAKVDEDSEGELV